MLAHPLRRSRWLGLLALLAVLAGLPLTLAAPNEGPGQTLPQIQRIVVAPDRLLTEVAKFPGEPRKLIGRADFEARVRQAEQATAARNAAVPGGANSPRLVEAHYRALLRDPASVAANRMDSANAIDPDLIGVARWQVYCPEPASVAGRKIAVPAMLPLQGTGEGAREPRSTCNLALRRPPREGDQDVLLAEVGGRGPALIFEAPGMHTVDLAWSSRLERTAEGLTLELRGPTCPAGVLELYLPAGWGVGGPAEVLFTGPLPLPDAQEGDELAPPAEFVLWRIHGIGRGPLRLTLSPVGESGPPLTLIRRWSWQHRLAPVGVDSTLEAALELLPHGGREVSFEWDPSLRPYAVQVAPAVREGAVPELAEWHLTPAVDDQPALLTLRLRRPVAELLVTVSALAPWPRTDGKAKPTDPIAWTAPGARVVRGVPRGETIELLIHPDLRLESWQTGDYYPTTTDTVADAARGVSYSRLLLAGGGLRPASNASPRRPVLRLHVSGVDFRARPVAWWQIDPHHTRLQVNIPIEVQQGRLFEVPVQVPNDWEIEQVEVEPASGASWRLHSRGRSRIQVEWQSPLTPASPLLAGSPGGSLRAQARIRLRLRPTSVALPMNRTLPFPEVIVPGARFREGALGIGLEDRLLEFSAKGKPTSPLPALDPEEDGPWGSDLPDAFYAYRQQALTGSLKVRPRPAQVSGEVRTSVLLAPTHPRESGGAAEISLRLEAEAGTPDSVVLLVPGHATPDWKWAVESGSVQLRRVERLPGPELLAALGNPGPLAGLSAGLGLTMPSQSQYRLVLSRPLRVGETVDLIARIRLVCRDGRWDVPVPTFPGLDRLEGEVELHLAGTELGRVEAEGLRESNGRSPLGNATGPGTVRPIGSVGPGRGPTAWRTFRYTSGPVRLQLQVREPTPGRFAEAFARLTAWPADHDRMRVHFQFHLADWAEATLPVTLPPGAELLGAAVDGRSLQPVIVARSGGEVVIPLPVPLRDGTLAGWHCFELLYALPAPQGWLWQKLQTPTPTLPVNLSSLWRTWRLPPGMLPVLASEANRLPGPGDGLEPPSHRFHPADLFRLLPWPRRWLGVFDAPEDGADSASLTFATRAPRPGQDLSLRELLEQLAQGAGRQRQDILVDAVAWREGRLSLQTRVRASNPAGEAAPVWEQAGLRLHPIGVSGRPGGWLLTTNRQLQVWSSGGRLPWPVDEAVEKALADGSDASGRFRSLADWLPMAMREERLGEDLAGGSLLPPGLEMPGWSAWLVTDGDDTAGLVVVRRETVATAGLLIALLGGLGLMALRRGRRWQRSFWFILWLGSAGLALLWLPTSLQLLAWYSLVLAGVLVFLAYLRRLRKVTGFGGPASVASTIGAAAAVLILLGALLGHRATAQVEAVPLLAGQPAGKEKAAEPERFAVFLVGRPDQGPEQQQAFVPLALLDRLERAADPIPAELRRGVVVTHLRCKGRLVAGVGEFEAELQLHCFEEGPTTFAFPLEGGKLETEASVWLDDARIPPLAWPAPPQPQAGFQIPVQGVGRHKLEVRFRVPVQSPGPGELALQFSLPRVLASQLSFTVPGRDAVLQIPGRVGAHQTRVKDGHATIEADLGRVTGPVQIRWSAATSPRQPVTVRYEEAYLWRLRHLRQDNTSTLAGMLLYHIEKGSVRELTLSVPANLVVRDVKATRPTGGEARLQGYQVRERPAGKTGQELVVRFQTPLTGDVLIALDLIPREPLPEKLELALPAPHGEQIRGFLAYTLEGLEVRSVDPLRLTGIRPNTFAPYWPAVDRPEAEKLVFAATFTRQRGTGADSGPELRLTLVPAPVPVQVEQDLTLRIGATQADLLARLDVSVAGVGLSLLEWDLVGPTTTLTSVRGAGLRRWSQQGNRLLVWLERTTATRLEVHGWLSLAQEPKKPARLDLPQVRLRSPGKQSTTLRLLAQPGLALHPQNLNGLVPTGVNPASPGEQVYTAAANYHGSVRVEPGGVLGSARVATFVEVVDRQFLFQTLVRCRVPQGELRSLSVTLRNWEGGVVTIDAERIVQRLERTHGNGLRTWRLDLLPGTSGEYAFTLSGSRPLADLVGPLTVPDVVLGGVPISEIWLAVAGPDLVATAGGNVQSEPALPDQLPPSWRGTERLRRAGGSVWRVTAHGPWQLRLTLTTPLRQDGRPCQVLLLERQIRPTGKGGWMHEASYWLRHEEQPELAVEFPRPARVSRVILAGVELPPLQPSSERLWVPLPGRPGVALLRLRWEYEPGDENSRQPRVEAPHLEGALTPGPTLWTLNVPPGWQSGPPTGLLDGPGPRILAHLIQAETALTIARQLEELAHEQGGPMGPTFASDQQAATQRRFYLHLRKAERLLDRLGEGEEVLAPDGSRASEWAARLAEQNRDQARPERLNYEEIRAEADRQVKAGLALASATPSTPTSTGMPRSPVVEGYPLGQGRGRLASEAPPLPTVGQSLRGWSSGKDLPAIGPVRPVWEESLGDATTASLAWLALVLGVGFLSQMEFLVVRLRYLIPEQLLLAGGLGYLVAGWTVVVLALLAVGVLGRFLFLVRWLRPATVKR